MEKLAQDHAARFAVYPDDASRGVACYVRGEGRGQAVGTLAQACPSRGTAPTRFKSGLPLSIRDVTYIEVLEPPAAKPEDLWGILPTADDRKPEEIIRAAWTASDRPRPYWDSCCFISYRNGGTTRSELSTLMADAQAAGMLIVTSAI